MTAIRATRTGSVLTPRSGISALILLLSTVASAQQRTNSVSVAKGNIVLRGASGVDRQLTHEGRDESPMLSPDGKWIAFVRKQPGPVIWSARGDVKPQEIRIIGVDGRGGKRLVRNRAKIGEATDLAAFYELHFSPDGRLLYFQTGCGMVNGCLYRVNVNSGQSRLVSGNVNGAEVLQSGRYAGYLLVQAHQYCTGDDPPCGSYEEIWLITPEGKTVYDIGPGELEPGNEMVARFKQFGTFPGPQFFAPEHP